MLFTGANLDVPTRNRTCATNFAHIVKSYITFKHRHVSNNIQLCYTLTYSIFEIYVNAYCDGKLKNLLPFSISEFCRISGNTFAIQKELLEGFQKLSKSNKLEFLNMFSKFT